MKLYQLLTEEMIIPELESTQREEVLKEMVNILKKKNKISKEKELLGKLIQREGLGTTAIGEGVAIPHCKMKGTRSPLVMLAISKKGVDFESIDGKPSQIFFLVVSSPENPSLNLQILATIAHLVRKSNSLKNEILRAKNTREIVEVIRQEEEKLNE